MKKTTTGFTLVELLIVIGIIAVLVMAVVPSFGPYLANQRTATISTDLYASLRLARSEAIDQGVNVRICPIVNGATTCSGSDWSKGWMVQNTTTSSVIEVHPEVFDNSIQACALTSSGIIFTPVGRVQVQPNCTMNSQPDVCPLPLCSFGAFLVSVENCTNMYQISIDPTGHITISSPLNCTTPPSGS